MERYSNFLSDIARKTQELITYNKSYFQEKVNDFISRYNYWKEQLLAGQREALKNKKRLYVGKMPNFRSKSNALFNLDLNRSFKEREWKESIKKKAPKGYILYDPDEIGFSSESDLIVKGIKGYYWGIPLPENPVDTLRIRDDSTIRNPPYTYNSSFRKYIHRKPINESEDLARKYFLLATIHTNIGEFGIPIIDPENQASQLVWFMYCDMDEGKIQVWGNKIKNFINIAMKDVKADLKQHQKETIRTIETHSSKSSQVLPVTTERNEMFERLERYKTPEDYFMKLEEFRKDPSKSDIVLTNPLFCFMDAIDWECAAIINRLKLALDYIKRKGIGNNSIDDTMIYNDLRQTSQQISYLLRKLKKGYWGFKWVLLSELRKVLSSLSSSIFLKIARAPLNYVPEEFEFMEKDLKILNNIHIQHIESKEAFGKRLNKMPFEEAIKAGFEKDALQQIEGDIEQNGDKAAQENLSNPKKEQTMLKAYKNITEELQQIVYLIDFWYRNDGTANPKIEPSFSYSHLADNPMTMWFSAFYHHFHELNGLIQNLDVRQKNNENVRALRIFIEASYSKLSALRLDIENTLRDCSYGQDKKECRIHTNGLMSEAINYITGTQGKDIREFYTIFTDLCNPNIDTVANENLTDQKKDRPKKSTDNLRTLTTLEKLHYRLIHEAQERTKIQRLERICEALERIPKTTGGKVGEMDESEESTNDKVKRLQEIRKGILILKDLKNSPADLEDTAGRFVEEALNLGAFNRPEHITLRKHVELRLSHNNVNPHISAWGEIILWLKHKKPPFPPSDMAKSFSADCDIVAKAILDEVKTIQKEQQSEPVSGDEAGKTKTIAEKLKKPISDKAAAVYELLKTMPEHRGLTGRKIIEELSKKKVFIDQSTLTKNIIPILKKDYGVKNQPRIGYYVEK